MENKEGEICWLAADMQQKKKKKEIREREQGRGHTC